MIHSFYCHGFASCFDTRSSKIQALEELGPVSGCSIDYTQAEEKVIAQVREQVNISNIDLFVGTSMGGWLAATLGASMGIPFVAINPVTEPSKTLFKYIDDGVDYQGNPYVLNATVVSGYSPIAKDGCGLILLDRGDEVLDANETAQLMNNYYRVEFFEGGNHRFSHMKEALVLIKGFYQDSEMVYGLDEN